MIDAVLKARETFDVDFQGFAGWDEAIGWLAKM
jgi:hypothetical protein